LAQIPVKNGLFAIGEIGFTPKIGFSKLPGKYAFGGFYYEQDNTSFFGAHYSGFYGFYWQVDQMLFRGPSHEEPASLVKTASDRKFVTDGESGKSLREPVPTIKSKLSDEGLYLFSLFTYAPKYNNILPFYFHTGLVYEGLIPTRDNDQLMAAWGLANTASLISKPSNKRGMSISRTILPCLKSTTESRLTNGPSFSPICNTSSSQMGPAPLRIPRL
jgi:porin